MAYLELCDFVLSQPELLEVNKCIQVLDYLQTVGCVSEWEWVGAVTVCNLPLSDFRQAPGFVVWLLGGRGDRCVISCFERNTMYGGLECVPTPRGLHAGD